MRLCPRPPAPQLRGARLPRLGSRLHAWQRGASLCSQPAQTWVERGPGRRSPPRPSPRARTATCTTCSRCARSHCSCHGRLPWRPRTPVRPGRVCWRARARCQRAPGARCERAVGCRRPLPSKRVTAGCCARAAGEDGRRGRYRGGHAGARAVHPGGRGGRAPGRQAAPRRRRARLIGRGARAGARCTAAAQTAPLGQAAVQARRPPCIARAACGMGPAELRARRAPAPGAQAAGRAGGQAAWLCSV